MNYMLPLYLDYLERPNIYEMIYLKEMKLKASHKTGSGAEYLKKKAKAATQQKIDNLAALNKKTTALAKTTKVGTTVKTAAKKVVPIPKIVPGIKTATPKVGTALKKMGGKAAMVAGGAAAAYGGYKLYKRHFSKAAKKCKGKSGAERTLCLQQATRS